MKLKIFFLILGKKIMIFKLVLSPQNFHYDVLYPLYSAMTHMKNLTIWKERNKNKRSMLTTKNSVKLHYHNGLKFLCPCIFTKCWGSNIVYLKRLLKKHTCTKMLRHKLFNTLWSLKFTIIFTFVVDKKARKSLNNLDSRYLK